MLLQEYIKTPIADLQRWCWGGGGANRSLPYCAAGRSQARVRNMIRKYIWLANATALEEPISARLEIQDWTICILTTHFLLCSTLQIYRYLQITLQLSHMLLLLYSQSNIIAALHTWLLGFHYKSITPSMFFIWFYNLRESKFFSVVINSTLKSLRCKWPIIFL